MKMNSKKFFAIILSATLALSLLSGCAGKKADTEAVQTSSAAASPAATSAEKRTVIVETADTFNPDGFLNEKGEPDGFDIAVAKEAAKLLPQYNFTYTTASVTNLETDLASGKADVVALESTKNGVSEKKFLYSNEPYGTLVTRFIVLASNTTYKTIDDFQGKTVYTVQGNDANALLAYNAKHTDNPIKLQYVSDPATCVKDLVDGRADAFVRGEVAIKTYGDTYGVKLKGVGDPVVNLPVYFKLKQSDTQLAADLDGAIKTLKSNGTLTQLHLKWHLKDYTPPYDASASKNQ